MSKRKYVPAIAVCFSCLLTLTACGKSVDELDLFLDDTTVHVALDTRSDVVLKEADDGFTAEVDGEKVSGSLISDEEANRLNSDFYDSSEYSLLNDEGFAFSEQKEKDVIYTHVLSVDGEDDVKICLQSENQNVLFRVENGLQFGG